MMGVSFLNYFLSPIYGHYPANDNYAYCDLDLATCESFELARLKKELLDV